LAAEASFAALAVGRLLALLAKFALLTLLAGGLLALLAGRLLALLPNRLLLVVAASFGGLFVVPFFSHREILLSEAPLALSCLNTKLAEAVPTAERTLRPTADRNRGNSDVLWMEAQRRPMAGMGGKKTLLADQVATLNRRDVESLPHQ
jgi:hypothetical protein